MIILIFGPAGAGKTTIANRLVDRLEDAYLISSDQFRKKVYERLIREVRKRREESGCLVVEGTFYKSRWREELRAAAEGEEMLEVFVYCSLETCIKRNRNRSQPIPEAAIHIIWKEFEHPENFDLEINAESLTPEEAAQQILDLLKETK